jgi:hypothetical protein
MNIRRSGVLSILGGVTAVLNFLVWLILTPFMATIWQYNGSLAPFWKFTPLVVRGIGRWWAERGAFTFAAPDIVYFSYGRYFFLVYLLIILGLVALHARLVTAVGGEVPRFYRRSYRLLLFSLLLACLSDFVSYGLGIFSDLLWSYGFGVELISLLGVLLSTLLYGVSLLRLRILPAWAGWLLMTAALLMPVMVVEQVLIAYWPNGPVLPISLAWAILGIYMLMTRPTGEVIISTETAVS